MSSDVERGTCVVCKRRLPARTMSTTGKLAKPRMFCRGNRCKRIWYNDHPTEQALDKARKMRKVMGREGLSQGQVAHRFNVSKQYVSRVLQQLRAAEENES